MPGAPLYEIRVHFEAEHEEEVERLTAAFERAVCPHRADEAHRCPNRWNITTIERDAAEAAQLQETLNQ